MIVTSKTPVDIKKAREKLQALASTLTPDTQLLDGLKNEIANAIDAGATLKQIWLSLRESGFVGNQTKLSDWMQEQGIRTKIKKVGCGKKKGTLNKKTLEKLQNKQSAQNTELGTDETPVSTNQEKTAEKPAETPQVKASADFQIDDDNYK